MKISTLFPISFLLLLPSFAQATTVSVSDFTGSGASFVEKRVLTESGLSLTNGETLVRVGFFTDLSENITMDLKSPDKDTVYNALSSYFVGLGEGGDSDLGTRASGGPRIVQRTVNGEVQQGRLFGNINSVNPGTYNPPDTITGVPTGVQIFVLVYDAPNAGAATQLGIFSSTDASWKMPSDPLLNITLNTTSVDNPAEIYRGTSGSIRLAALVPEPSASSLVFAVFALGLRRKRRFV